MPDRGEAPLPVDIALRVSMPEERAAFLAMTSARYKANYLEKLALTEHPLAALPVTHIYIGSEICPLLLPGAEEAARCAEKALTDGVTPVLCLPFMPDSRADMYFGLIRAFTAVTAAHGIKTEILLNDLGTALMLRERDLSASSLSLIAGPLICRRRRDPRAAAVGRAADGPVSADAPFFREYLKDLGFRRFSGKDEIDLPLNIMNLSSFCTTRAYAMYGDRGHGTEDTDCPVYCDSAAFIYADGVNTVGIGGALLDADTLTLNSSPRLNALIRGGVDRVVLW